MTNKDAHVADRLRVAPAWVQLRVMIKAGKGIYPAIIKKWGSVQALAKDKILTIGAEYDTTDDAYAIETAERLEREIGRYKKIADDAKKTAIKEQTPSVGDLTEQ